MSCFDAIRTHLTAAGVPFRTVHHAPTRTSEASAAARGEALAAGAKALVLKVDGTFGLFVLSAARRLDGRAVRARFGARRVRFATPEELAALTGLVPGAVPPFGRPFFDLDLYADPSLFEQPHLAFNAGSLTDSILMAPGDYRRVARPEVFAFSRAPAAPSPG